MTDSPQLECKRCREAYLPVFGQQLFCNRCRRVMVSAENAAVAKQRRRDQELADSYRDEFVHMYDTLIIDEWGREVWASDLAQRYRKELNARQHKDFRHRR